MKSERREKRIMDFEDYGGVDQALKDIYVPNVSNFETDSVYKLK